MKKPYQIDKQRAVQKFRASRRKPNSTIQFALPLPGSVEWSSRD